jgi:hypothetical protein
MEIAMTASNIAALSAFIQQEKEAIQGLSGRILKIINVR